MLKTITNKIKKLKFSIAVFFSDQYSISQVYQKQYGIKFGKNVRITGRPTWGTEPYLIEIGDNVTITQNVAFHTHDGGVGLFRGKYPGINVFGRIKIGDNVFIGSHTIFLPGVEIGDNVIIGAGSIVSKNIPSNSVAVGVPARVIKSIEDYKEEILRKAVYINSRGNKRKAEILSKI